MIILTPDAKYKFIGRDNDEDDEAVVRETWVENVYEINEGLLDDTGIMIDIGANIGSVSVFAASLGDKVKVYAYEPEPHNLELLEQNVQLNGLEKQIRVFDQAVWSHSQKLKITDGSGSSEIADKGQTVEATRLVDIFADNRIANCDLLKLDVEGSEYQIIPATPIEILRKIKHLRMEFHKPPEAVQFGLLVYILAQVFNLHIVGQADVGGNIYGDRF